MQARVGRCFLRGPCRDVITRTVGATNSAIRVEAGSNTSTVTLRVVGGDGKESLKSKTVKYGHESKWLGHEKDYAVEGQHYIQKTDPSSCQRGAPEKQDRNCQRVINIWLCVLDEARHQDLLIDWPSIAMWLWPELSCLLLDSEQRHDNRSWKISIVKIRCQKTTSKIRLRTVSACFRDL
jgi:hypothetical protein